LRFLYLIAAIPLLAVVAACGHEQDGGGASALPTNNLTSYTSYMSLEEAEDAVGYDISVPEYVPSGLPEAPIVGVEFYEDNRRRAFVYFAGPLSDAAIERAFIMFEKRKAPSDFDLGDAMSVKGTRVRIADRSTPERRALHAEWVSGELFVMLDLQAGRHANIGTLQEEGRRIIESVLVSDPERAIAAPLN
jgi:hypothetical protein